MKHSGRNIKQRLYGLTLIGNRLSRIRHFRGHGVHSPFVYSLVRKVFMRRTLIDPEQDNLYNALVELQISPKRAIELQNIATLLEYHTFSIDSDQGDADFNIITTSEVIDIRTAFECTKSSGTTLVILTPYLNKERREICRELIESHNSTSVDNRGYLIFFNNHLPKQHYRL